MAEGAGDGIEAAIAASRRDWPGPYLEETVFGVADAAAVADAVRAAVHRHLGVAVVRAELWQASVGCTAGLHLDDGTAVALKVHQPRVGAPYLRAASRVQRWLHAAALPCPRPRHDPIPVGLGWATVDDLAPPPPDERRAGDATTRTASATTLAQVTAAATTGASPADRAALAAHPLRPPPDGALWPEPHSPLFDLGAGAADAAWIDDLATAARAARDAGATGPVVTHTDWAHRNVRFAADGAVAVAYDWDSLATVDEMTGLGQAAMTWRATGEADDTDPFPGADEVDAYLDAYGAARGRPLRPDERRRARAAAVWTLAYTARCEHALAHRVPAVPAPTAARSRLADTAAALLP